MFSAIASLILGSVLMWASNHGRLVRRQTEFTRAQYAAEAGAEKVFAALRSNVMASAVAPNQSVLDVMATNQLPTSADDSSFASYRYVTSTGTSNKIAVTAMGTTSGSVSSGPYVGLNASTASYRITSRANSYNRPVNLTTGVQRDVQIQTIAIFQFAVFYQGRLEILPGPAMTLYGRIHSNGDSYYSPLTGLTVEDNVTSAGAILQTPPPELLYAGSPYLAPRATPVFIGTVTASVDPLNLPIQAATPHDVIEPPPIAGSDPIPTQRLYNQAGLLIRVSNTGITVKNGAGAAVALPAGSVSTNKTLYNFREIKTVAITEIDINAIRGAGKMPANGVLYVDDTRTAPQQTAVRLINGASLTTGSGLSVVTPNPIYIKGDFNTSGNRAAAIYADAINVLSANWNDANSSLALASRIANSGTVNAAFFTGNVPTVGTTYSGGLENLPRFLENWAGQTFTYSGSMVCMFDSETATGSQANSSYGAPTRAWSFDTDFLDPSKLPPGTPSVRTIARSGWASVQ